MRWYRSAVAMAILGLMLCAGAPTWAKEATGAVALQVKVLSDADLRAALDVAPADAQLVFVVPNLASLNKKIAAFGESIGVHTPEMADALGSLKRNMGIAQGMKDDGSLLLVIQDFSWFIDRGNAALDAQAGKPVAALPQEEPPIIVLIPVSDYAAFVGNFGGKADEAVTAITLQGSASFAKKVEGYAVLGPTKAGVENYKPGKAAAAYLKSAGTGGAKYLLGADAAILVNAAPISAKLQALLTKAMDQMSAQMDMMPFDAKMLGMVKSVFAMYRGMGELIVAGTDTAVVALDLNDQGIGLTSAAQFKPGSDLAKIFPGAPAPGGGATTSQLVSLPVQPYLLAAAGDAKAINVKLLMDRFGAMLPADGFLTDIFKMVSPLIALHQASAQAVYLPQAGLMSGMPQVHVVQTADAKALVKLNQEVLLKLNSLSIPMPLPPGAAPPAAGAPTAISYKTEYTPNVMQIDGLNVDQYKVQVNFPPQLMQNNPMAPLMMALGATGQNGYVVAADATHMVTTTVADAALLKATLASLKSGQGLGTDKLIAQARAGALPANPAMEMYVSASGIATLANSILGMFGGPQIKPPGELPPIAFGAAIADGGMTSRLHVPMAVITFVKDTIAQMNAGGGRNPNAPRGPGNGPPPAPF